MTDREQLTDRLRKIAANHHKLALQAIEQGREDDFDFHFEVGSEADRLLDKIKAEAKEND